MGFKVSWLAMKDLSEDEMIKKIPIALAERITGFNHEDDCESLGLPVGCFKEFISTSSKTNA